MILPGMFVNGKTIANNTHSHQIVSHKNPHHDNFVVVERTMLKKISTFVIDKIRSETTNHIKNRLLTKHHFEL